MLSKIKDMHLTQNLQPNKMLKAQSTAQPRTSPYVWVTWITKLMSGEESCKFKLWFRANNQNYTKAPSTFNLSKWSEDHTALIEIRKRQLEEDGYEVFLEGQNSFLLEGRTGVKLAGKADIVAIKDDDAVVIDCKTGQQRNSDVTQVKLYMLALPLANQRHRGLVLRGEVQYRSHAISIPCNAIDGTEFNNRLSEIMKFTSLVDNQQIDSLSCASYGECRFCDLTSADCRWRVEKDQNNGITKLF
jgi:hypothetical protein